MIGEQHIETAIARGIISRDQAAQLRALAAVPAAPFGEASDPDDERFRLIGGFNDVFVTVGIVLLVSALFGLSSTLGFGIAFVIVALVAAWGLSEVFARHLRLALPAIALSLMFACAGGLAAYMIANSALQATGAAEAGRPLPISLLLGLGAAATAALHRWRFRVPIDTAIIAAGLACALMGAFEFAAPDWTKAHKALLLAGMGTVILAAAIRIDATDTLRVTRRSDVAFWLHLLAAPMLVHAVSSLLFGPATELGVPQALGILALFAVFGLIAVVLDRRALLVSGLSYAGLAIGYLLSERLSKDVSLSLTLLGLAALVLLLSAQWRSLRRAALLALPLGGVRQLVPPAS